MSTPLIEITGFKELQEKLKLLGDDKAKRQAMLRVLRKVAQGTVSVAKAKAPVSKKAHTISGKRSKQIIQPGNLSKSIGVIAVKSENPAVVVGPRAKGKNLGFYGAMVERGHNIYKGGFKRKHSASDRARAHNASGATGRTKAIPFMKDTYDQTKGQVTAETEKQVVAFIKKETQKLGLS